MAKSHKSSTTPLFTKYILIAVLAILVVLLTATFLSHSSTSYVQRSSHTLRLLEHQFHKHTSPKPPPIGGVDSIQVHDLDRLSRTSSEGWKHGERVLILTPLRDAEKHVNPYLDMLSNLTYPHNLIDLVRYPCVRIVPC